MQSYDIIGDIHGHADELEALLARLGYAHRSGVYKHPGGRMAIFLGDYIDRGPEIRRVLDLVRSMVREGSALAILGNHEVNALRYHARDAAGVPLREHSAVRRRQHAATLEQIANPHPRQWSEYLAWFTTIPLWLDLGALRAVHASWDHAAIEHFRDLDPLSNGQLERHSRKGTPGHDRLSALINGPEAGLPDGSSYRTDDGALRREIRVKWWRDLTGLSARGAIFPDSPEFPEIPLASTPAFRPYPPEAPPVFFGHYAIKAERPRPTARNLACLDYGAGKGGFLCAYRWDGERQVDDAKFVTTQREPTR